MGVLVLPYQRWQRNVLLRTRVTPTHLPVLGAAYENECIALHELGGVYVVAIAPALEC